MIDKSQNIVILYFISNLSLNNWLLIDLLPDLIMLTYLDKPKK